MTTLPISDVVSRTSAIVDPMKATPIPAASTFPTTSADTTQADASGFTQALANAPSLPEHHLLSAAGKLAGNTERLAQRASMDERTLDEPIRMLDAQREITERVLALEVVAKVAGATTQSVNKLVHMQ